MEAEGKSFKFLLDFSIYVIPFFQRAYVWREDNWEELIENLSSDKPSFLGSIIVKASGIQQPGKASVFSVIDGQQRLTTISILLKVISEVIPEEMQKIFQINIPQYIYHVDLDTCIRDLKLHHSKYDMEYFSKVLNPNDEKPIDISEINSDSHPILRCYKYFKETLTDLFEKDKKDVINIYRKLVDQKCIVLITLVDDDREQAIFDTINNAGVKLTSADTIKNSIFQRALELCETQEEKNRVIKKYESSWEAKFSADMDQVNFWDSEKRVGRVMRTNLEIFLHSFAVIKGIFNPQSNKLEDLAQCYKDYISRMNLLEMFSLIEEIDEYANAYNLTWCEYDPSKMNFENLQHRIFLIFDKYDVSTYTPYVLYCVKNFDLSECEKKLKILETYLIRNIICGRSTKNYNKECYSVIHGEFDLENALKMESLSDQQVKIGIHHMNNKQATLILFLIELHRRSNDKIGEKTLSYSYTLEHIMPQDLGKDWGVGLVPVYGKDGDLITDAQEAELYRTECIYSLGNMTLLTKSLNSSIKNRSLKDKIEGHGKVPGIENLSTLLITVNDIILPFKSGNFVWDERKIIERENKFLEEILSIWPL